MRFEVKNLQRKNLSELRDIFSAIPRTEDSICLQGHFELDFFTTPHITRALNYLPKHVQKIVFKVIYFFSYHTYKQRVGTTRIPGSGEVGIYETRRRYTKEIGNSLKTYIASLPKSIEFVGFNFIERNQEYTDTTVFAVISDILKVLPPHVNTLHLNNLIISPNQHKISQLFKNIPDTVQFLCVGKLKLGRLHFTNGKSVFSAMSSKVTLLNLVFNQLYRLGSDCFDSFFDSMPGHLKTLNLGHNEFNKKNTNELGLFLSKVPLTLEKLRLHGNQFSTVNAKSLANVLSVLPETLIELDIGENGLMLLAVEEFTTILNGLSKNITSLRVCEQDKKGAIRLSKEDLSTRLLNLPGHIKVLNVCESNLLGLSVMDFIDVVATLETIEGLDLSSNNLRKKRLITDLIYLLSHLPRHIRMLKLNHNSLGCFELTDLKAILSALSPWVIELDVSNNGLDRLPYTQMRAVLTFFPNTVKYLITGSNEFTLRNDGALVPFTGISQAGLFKPQKRFYHQSEFASLRLVMMQLIQSSRLALETVLHILSYVLNAIPAELKFIGYSLSTALISSVPPLRITSKQKQQCINAITQRIETVTNSIDNINPYCLDLSRCGLNRLITKKSQRWFVAQIKALSHAITTLNLRGNGFLHDDRSREVFIALMKKIPRKIKCLDLSDNGFEHKTAEELANLFLHLPPTIQRVRLDHEQPISPLLQIAKRHWPETYLALTKGATNKLQQAHKLFNDYKGKSALWRFLSGHWDHNHIEVARLVYYIKKGLITSADDFSFELEQIKLNNETDSLARRFNFLTYHQLAPTNRQSTNEENGLDNDTHCST